MSRQRAAETIKSIWRGFLGIACGLAALALASAAQAEPLDGSARLIPVQAGATTADDAALADVRGRHVPVPEAQAADAPLGVVLWDEPPGGDAGSRTNHNTGAGNQQGHSLILNGR